MSTATHPAPARQHWIDLLRGAAVVLVIAYHLRLLQNRWNGGTPEAVIEMSEALSPFRMPALLFASGLLLAHSLEKPAGTFVRGKLRGLLWPWLLWSALMLPLMGWENATQPLWWVNGTFTWFLLALCAYYLIALLARRIPPGWIALTAGTAWTVLPPLGLELHMTGDRPDKILYYAVFFFAGAALRDLLTRRLLPWPLLSLGLLLAAGWAWHAATADERPMTPVLAPLVVLISVVSVLGALRRLPRMRILRPLEWMGRHSIVPYLVHVPVMLLLMRLVELPPTMATYLLFFALTTGACVLALLAWPWTAFLYRFPVLGRVSERLPLRAWRGARLPVMRPAAGPELGSAPRPVPVPSAEGGDAAASLVAAARR